MNRKWPKWCLKNKKKLGYFQKNIKKAYVNNDKEKYELLKLKTECKWLKPAPIRSLRSTLPNRTRIYLNPYILVLLNADMLYMELDPKSIDNGKPIGIEILFKPRNINTKGNEMSPVDFEIYFMAGLGKKTKLKELAETINFQNNE